MRGVCGVSNFFDTGFKKRGRGPVWTAFADRNNKVLNDFFPFRGMSDFRVKLNAILFTLMILTQLITMNR